MVQSGSTITVPNCGCCVITGQPMNAHGVPQPAVSQPVPGESFNMTLNGPAMPLLSSSYMSSIAIGAGLIVTVTVAVSVHVIGVPPAQPVDVMEMRYVNVSMPEKPVLGVYTRQQPVQPASGVWQQSVGRSAQFCTTCTLPLGGCVTIVRLLQLSAPHVEMSLSRTQMRTGRLPQPMIVSFTASMRQILICTVHVDGHPFVSVIV